MPSNKSPAQALDRITTEYLTLPTGDWSPNLMAVFVRRLSDACGAERKGPMVEVQGQLDALLRYALRTAPDEVRAGVLANMNNQFKTAFLLGSLSFAHQFASTVAQGWPEDEFYVAFEDPKTKKIVGCLANESRSKSEVAEACGFAAATVDQEMKRLLRLGIVDFRTRYGAGAAGVAEYFLTPAAQQMLANAK